MGLLVDVLGGAGPVAADLAVCHDAGDRPGGGHGGDAAGAARQGERPEHAVRIENVMLVVRLDGQLRVVADRRLVAGAREQRRRIVDNFWVQRGCRLQQQQQEQQRQQQREGADPGAHPNARFIGAVPDRLVPPPSRCLGRRHALASHGRAQAGRAQRRGAVPGRVSPIAWHCTLVVRSLIGIMESWHSAF